jgi:YfiH family protein
MRSTDPHLVPDWPAPPRVRALSTTRAGGVSLPPFGAWAGGRDGEAGPGGLNLGNHVGDDADRVAQNRARLRAWLPAEPHWLEQVHGCTVFDTASDLLDARGNRVADAAVADRPGEVCLVMTADCLPVLLCDTAGSVVGAAHAGWRGLCNGVLEATLERMRAKARALGAGCGEEWLAWLGPAIGPTEFEVGADVRDAFLAAAAPHERVYVELAFLARETPGKYLADLAALARVRLARLDCTRVYGGEHCTVGDPARFYSYRRDKVTGRMASLVWLQD